MTKEFIDQYVAAIKKAITPEQRFLVDCHRRGDYEQCEIAIKRMEAAREQFRVQHAARMAYLDAHRPNWDYDRRRDDDD